MDDSNQSTLFIPNCHPLLFTPTNFAAIKLYNNCTPGNPKCKPLPPVDLVDLGPFVYRWESTTTKTTTTTDGWLFAVGLTRLGLMASNQRWKFFGAMGCWPLQTRVGKNLTLIFISNAMTWSSINFRAVSLFFGKRISFEEKSALLIGDNHLFDVYKFWLMLFCI